MPEKSIPDALSRAGVRSYAADPSEPSGQGALFFDQITQRLCHFLSEASRRGLERILAVALSHSALAERGAWRLLQAGASDVFAWDHSTDPAQEVRESRAHAYPHTQRPDRRHRHNKYL